MGSVRGPSPARPATSEMRRVEMWRGDGRSNISVAAPFVWRCLTGSAVAPFPQSRLFESMFIPSEWRKFKVVSRNSVAE
jgi:hypothetical protein